MNTRAKRGITPLGAAVLNGDKEMVRLLIENGADVNCKDDGGCSPLTIAEQMNYPGIARLLLKNGAKD